MSKERKKADRRSEWAAIADILSLIQKQGKEIQDMEEKLNKLRMQQRTLRNIYKEMERIKQEDKHGNRAGSISDGASR